MPDVNSVKPIRLASSRSTWLIAGLLLTVLVFGVLVEIRSAFFDRRMGDLDVFVRAAWAVRSGDDLYGVTDDKGFHYQYPPLLAIVLTPLADPPEGVDRSWVLPYSVIAAAWYCLNVLFLAIAVHWLASALEDPAARSRPRGDWRWWALRLWPVLVCLPPIGHTLMRGQVNLLLLLLLCGMASAMLRGRRLQAGVWLAGAVCLKFIPAFLILYPLVRRDGRGLVGCALGMVLGLGVIPAAVFGPVRTAAYCQEWAQVVILPALGAGTDTSRDKELIETTVTDSQSFQAALHNTQYPDKDDRPPHPSWLVRCAHWLAAGGLTLLTLWMARPRHGDRSAEIVAFGALVIVMLIASPINHLHYFCLALPLAMGVTALWLRTEDRRVGAWLIAVGSVFVAANVLALLPGLRALRDCGLVLYPALLLWLVGMLFLRRTAETQKIRIEPKTAKAA